MKARFPIRTITAFCDVAAPDDPSLAQALDFLPRARAAVLEAGYETQTVRVAVRLRGPRPDEDWLARVGDIDARVAEAQALWAGGPELAAADPDAFPTWASRAVARTAGMFLSVEIAPAGGGVDARAARVAARTIARLAAESADGEGNFRFAAAARCPAGIPFFPVARHEGAPAFAIALESADLVERVYGARPEDPTAALRAALGDALAPLAALGRDLAAETGRAFLGIDTSAAPGLDASIERCGYSGLLLPVLEDRVLAARAAEGRYSVRDLLLWSSVCGTGLDVVPLAGDVSEDELTRLLLDVGALASRLAKPLSARLLPVPGTKPGDQSHFNNPWLVNTSVLAVE